MKGNIVDWTNAEWDVTNMEKIDVDLSNMCTTSTVAPIIIPERLGAKDLIHLCHKFNGHMFVIESESTRQKAVEFRQSKEKCAGTNIFQKQTFVHYFCSDYFHNSFIT